MRPCSCASPLDGQSLQFSDRRHLDQGVVEASGRQGEPKVHVFMRVHFDVPGGLAIGVSLREQFEPVAQVAGMRWQLRPHGEMRLAEWHGIPFFHVPISAGTKPAAEARLLELVDELEVELVVLARYMQVLSDELTRKLDGRAINIHHSFLPSFKGAKPYHQAYVRGVKTVGATAHYVNSELDEGPIISQQIVEVDHAFGPDDLVTAGRDTDCKALSNAVRWNCEGRVILHGSRTEVLR